MPMLTSQQSAFVKSLCQAAWTVARARNWPWTFVALTVGQGALEAGYGKSTLAAKFNNLFGIKYANQPGAKQIVMMTKEVDATGEHEVPQAFAWFDSFESCMEARAALFDLPRYLDVLTAPTIEEACRDIMNDGYSSDRPFLWTPADGKTQAEIEAGPKLCQKPGCRHYAGSLMDVIVTCGMDTQEKAQSC